MPAGHIRHRFTPAGNQDQSLAQHAGLRAFTCPVCGVHANQRWYGHLWSRGLGNAGPPLVVKLVDLRVSTCTSCGKYTLWKGETQIHPRGSEAPAPSENLSRDVLADFEEARMVLATSPRASAALLRLAIQKMCILLGKPGENLNDDIGALVQEGLPRTLQQALDTVRVIGNNAVHPGQVDLRDDKELALALFRNVNLFADWMIGQPHQVAAAYARIPAGARQAVDRRDRR